MSKKNESPGFLTTYDQSVGLVSLIKRGLGERNAGNINCYITQERFPLKGTDIQSVKCRVEAYLSGETSEQAAKRLTDAGHVLASIGDLAGFLHDHPDEMAKWYWVDAISEASRWTGPYSYVCVPYAIVEVAHRYFNLSVFCVPRDSRYGVLVLCG